MKQNPVFNKPHFYTKGCGHRDAEEAISKGNSVKIPTTVEKLQKLFSPEAVCRIPTGILERIAGQISCLNHIVHYGVGEDEIILRRLLKELQAATLLTELWLDTEEHV